MIEDKLASYDAIMLQENEGFESNGVNRLAEKQRLEKADEAFHIAQAFNESAIFMQMYRDATGVQLEAYLEQCGFSESVVAYIMQSINAYMTEKGMPA